MALAAYLQKVIHVIILGITYTFICRNKECNDKRYQYSVKITTDDIFFVMFFLSGGPIGTHLISVRDIFVHNVDGQKILIILSASEF